LTNTPFHAAVNINTNQKPPSSSSVASPHNHAMPSPLLINSSSSKQASALNATRAQEAYTDGVKKVKSGNKQGAREAFLLAITLDPTHSMAWNELGYLRETHEKDIDGALSAYRSGRLFFHCSCAIVILLLLLHCHDYLRTR
jgi:Flp pilus assembly protein TadD